MASEIFGALYTYVTECFCRQIRHASCNEFKFLTNTRHMRVSEIKSSNDELYNCVCSTNTRNNYISYTYVCFYFAHPIENKMFAKIKDRMRLRREIA